MNIKIVFRSLIVIPILLTVVYFFLPAVEYLWVSCDELNLLEADGYNAIIKKNNIIFWIYIASWLLVSVLLFFFIKFSRIIYIIFMVLSLPAVFLFGDRIASPLQVFIMTLTTLSLGAVMALMYSSSTTELFNKSVEEETKEDDEDEDEL